MESTVVTKTPRPPKVFAALAAAWILVLVLLIVFRWQDVFGLGDLKDPVAGFLPLIVPWAGALGGATISLIGTAKHSRDWDDSWNLWHAIRPLSGAVAGTVSFFVVVIVLRTAGGLKESAETLALTPTSIGLFFVIAFVTGFRDSIFLNLIGQVANVLFATGTDSAEPVSYSVDATEIDFGRVPVPGGKVSRTVRVTLTGGTEVVLAKNWLSVGDPAFQAVELPVNVLGARRRDIEVSFTPDKAGVVRSTLKFEIAEQPKEVALTGEGFTPDPPPAEKTGLLKRRPR